MASDQGLFYINSKFCESHKTVIRSNDSCKCKIQSSLTILGEEIGKAISENFFIDTKTITTPMDQQFSGYFQEHPLVSLITTIDDAPFLGAGLLKIFENSISGHMDFSGLRGPQALNAKIRNINLPDSKLGSVNTLIVAKSVLATGCTAISLTKAAIQKYMPRNVIIASIFYSMQGVTELRHSLANADIFLIGAPDKINTNGMLEPGVGNLDERQKVS